MPLCDMSIIDVFWTQSVFQLFYYKHFVTFCGHVFMYCDMLYLDMDLKYQVQIRQKHTQTKKECVQLLYYM